MSNSEDDISSETLMEKNRLKRQRQKDIAIHQKILSKHYKPQLKRRKLINNKYVKKCCICLDVIRNATFLPCCHHFHNACIEEWSSNNNIICPECRIPMFIQDHDQLDEFNTFKVNKLIMPNLENLSLSDNSLALIYIKDPKYMHQPIDSGSSQKIQNIRSTEDPDFIERYNDIINDSSDDESDITSDLTPEQVRHLRTLRELQVLQHYEVSNLQRLNTT
jgi:hypothetical protein